MDIQRLIEENPQINITVSGQDLQEYSKSLVKETTEALLQKQEERVFTAVEVEQKFNICPATRWRWDKMGILKGQRIGNRLYYLESDLQKLMNKKREGHSHV